VAVDHFLLPNIAPEVVSALSCTGEQQPGNAVGVIETYSAASAVVAADTAVKASQVTIMEVRLAMGLGGKAICLLSGDVASVQAAVSSASAAVAETGLLVRQVVISGISPELLPYIM
jgi:microcompartment protein CcmL/EutN